jgi:hypothetical protein
MPLARVLGVFDGQKWNYHMEPVGKNEERIDLSTGVIKDGWFYKKSTLMINTLIL